MAYELKTNTATRIAVGPLVDPTDGKTAETALTVTALSVEIFQIKNDGSAVVRTAFSPTASAGNNDMVHVTDDTTGMYDLELTAAQLNWLGNGRIAFYDVDGFLVHWIDIQVVSAPYFNWKYGTTNPQVDVDTIKTQTVTCAAGVTVLASVGTAATSTAQTGDTYTLANGATGFAAIDTVVDAIKVKTDYLPSATAGASGGLLISGSNSGTTTLGALTVTGATTLTGAVTGTNASNDLRGISVNMIKDQSITCTTGVTINANVGTTQPVNFTGTGATAYVKSDVIQISSDGMAADNAESFFDGTGYAGTNNVIPTVTTVTTTTNLTNAATNGDFTSTMKSSITAAVPTAAAISDAVWDEDSTGHTDAGKAGAQLWTDIDAILADTGTDGVVVPQAQADKVWGTAARTLTAATNITSTGGTTVPQTGDSFAIVNSGTYGNSALKTLIDTVDDYLDTEIASILAAVDTEVAAILADTNELQTDLVNGGRLDLLIDAIKAKTDTIPTSPASEAANSVLWKCLHILKNKMTVLESAPGTVTLRNEGDTGTIATGTVASSSGTTTRGELTFGS